MSQYILFLIELRKRILNFAIVFGVLFSLTFFFSQFLFHWYMLPLLNHIPYQDHLIATQIGSPLLTPLSIAANIALLACAPYGLFQGWRFASPALYPNEQRHLKSLMMISVGLFVLGTLFCYFLILPWMFQCIVQAVPKEVVFMPDIGSATHFITSMMLIFGLSFQIPLLCMVLVRIKLVSRNQLINCRPYVIVTAFTLGMLLTPPDVISQILLALPLWGLYESGVFLSRIYSLNR